MLSAFSSLSHDIIFLRMTMAMMVEVLLYDVKKSCHGSVLGHYCTSAWLLDVLSIVSSKVFLALTTELESNYFKT